MGQSLLGSLCQPLHYASAMKRQQPGPPGEKQKGRQRGQKRKVLPEEEYQDALTHIVRRDYFPDLPELEKQLAIQQVKSGNPANYDISKVIQIRKAARQLQQHEEYLAQQEEEQEQETVAVTSIVPSPSQPTTSTSTALLRRKVPRPLHRESLSGFHQRVTSEDNAEFEQVQRQELSENRQARDKWLQITNNHDNQNASTTSRDRTSAVTATPLLALASDEFNATPIVTHNMLTTAPANNAFFFPPSSSTENDTTCEENTETRLLMPPPTAGTSKKHEQQLVVSDKDKSHDVSSRDAAKMSMVEYIPKASLVKKIEPSATRFPRTNVLALRSQGRIRHAYDQSSNDESSSTTTGDVTTDLDEDSDIDGSTTSRLNLLRWQGQKRKRRELETFVQMTPEIRPGRAQEGQWYLETKDGASRRDLETASPIITWGQVEATPLALSQQEQEVVSESSKLKSFELPQESDRDKAAEAAERRLQERAKRSRTKSKRPSSAKRASTPFSSPPSRSVASVSARSRSAFGTALRSAYSQPASTRPSSSLSTKQSGTKSRSSVSQKGKTAAVHRDHAYLSTPRLNVQPSARDSDSRHEYKKTGRSKSSSITDNLLNLG